MTETGDAPPCAPPDFAPRKPRLAFAPLACDCHAHILGPASLHAYSPERVYTPPDCLAADYRAMLATLGVERAVLVQPSVYGADNTVMLQALREAGPAFRAVAVVDWSVGDEALDSLHAAGVRGVRVNVVDVVFGHLGYMRTAKGIDAPGYQALLRLMRHGRCWVKLTGPYRISGGAMPHADVTLFAHALLRAAPDRVVWGSDWPHVMVKGPMPNDGDLADLLLDWIPDEDLRRRVMADNPARLYGFPPP